MNVVGKTGFAGPLIRPTGTFSPLGRRGIERARHIPFAPRAGSEGRCRQADEGLVSAIFRVEVRAPCPLFIASARPGDPFEGRRFGNTEIQLVADRLGAFERCQH
ncbi:hypothetical protein E0I74_28910 [Rhizobium laguerreae]|nr:hypothetical protein [Rhizobium laguerreae]NKM71402.1 hypothetical protein [Rhizobium laguerreae]NKM88821.1 hypothetical protein [Rhizobium laguerreae]TBX73837.1 hypothetical protein E0I74_28910 [Rhizobium laguerreae]TBY07249.1 hypothetical protein E0I94_20535 [Rhizobium laguerreae]